MENASRAFLDAVRKSMRQIRRVLGAATIDPDLLTAPICETRGGCNMRDTCRRKETNAVLLGLAKEGASIKEIVRRTGLSRGLVRKVVRGQRSDVFRVRESSLEPHLPWLEAQWAAEARNGAELWRQLRGQGFRGCLRLVSEWATRRRRAEKVNGIVKDQAAVRTAIVSPWSNGQTEGQITKLKLVKRQMYGRGKIDLLQARVIGAQ